QRRRANAAEEGRRQTERRANRRLHRLGQYGRARPETGKIRNPKSEIRAKEVLVISTAEGTTCAEGQKRSLAADTHRSFHSCQAGDDRPSTVAVGRQTDVDSTRHLRPDRSAA